MATYQIKSLDHLRDLVVNKFEHRFFIRLNFGLRSSKYIWEGGDGRLWVENDIDGSECPLEDTNIPEAIEKGAFYGED